MSEIESRNVKKIVQEIMRECSEQGVQVHENFVHYYVSITSKLLETNHLHAATIFFPKNNLRKTSEIEYFICVI